MTPRDQFKAAYLRVARAMAAPVDHGQAAECWRILEHYPGDVFDAAATRLIASCQFMPKPVEWIGAVRDAIAAREASSVAPIEQPLAPGETYCAKCDDTGWRYVGTRVTACECRANNPVYQRKRRGAVLVVSTNDAKRVLREIGAEPRGL